LPVMFSICPAKMAERLLSRRFSNWLSPACQATNQAHSGDLHTRHQICEQGRLCYPARRLVRLGSGRAGSYPTNRRKRKL
jgi:hypothetical protein